MLLRLKYIIQGIFHFILSKFKELKNHELYSARLSICNSCEFNKNGICSDCGCVIKFKTKSDAKCSRNKWI
jgi:hypothetical protein